MVTMNLRNGLSRFNRGIVLVALLVLGMACNLVTPGEDAVTPAATKSHF